MHSLEGKLMLFEANFSAIIPIALEAIQAGTIFFSLKMDLFLASHNCQQRFLGIEAQSRLIMGFLFREPRKFLGQSLRSWATESGRFRTRPRGRTLFQSVREILHWRKMWLVVYSSMLHRAHLEGPIMPLFLRFSAVKSLLCIRIHVKIFTLGMLSGCQTFF